MQVHYFNHETRLYAGSAIADQSPREPGVFPVPAFACASPLPASVTLTAVPGSRELIASIPEGKLLRLDLNEAWVLEDIPPAPVTGPVEPTEPEPVKDPVKRLQSRVQQYMDATARAMGYDDIFTAVTYAEEPAVPKFQAEGQALRAWRSLVWAACYELLAQVQGGVREEPTEEELFAELPLFVAPESPAPEEPSPEEPAPEGNAPEGAE